MPEDLKPIQFSVDSALFRELGERLVGKAHIALAELIKNSYDADATKVEIEFGKDFIEVRDNGHGMTFEEFRRFWMRVGSPHKQKFGLSRKLKRPVTGSKGVGRLAVQFLADQVSIVTVPDPPSRNEIFACVDWNEAVKAKELTRATALWRYQKRETEFPLDKSHGTVIRLTGLHQSWDADDLRALAQEIWILQPPFKRSTPTNESTGFSISVAGVDAIAIGEFEDQMQLGLRQWIAKISGRIRRDGTRSSAGQVDVRLEFNDGTVSTYTDRIDPCRVSSAEFEVRIFLLQGRQKGGVRVNDAREYLSKFGGVHIYDAGFHLPYYGPDTDWLGIERDHAARLSESKLLPRELQIERGMQFLPTQRRIFGVVNINTGTERTSATKRTGDQKKLPADEFLKIQVSRDRLVDNGAYRDLRRAVRVAIDFYAVEAQRRNQKDLAASEKSVPISQRFERIAEILDFYRDRIPPEVFRDLRRQLQDAASTAESEAQTTLKKLGLLGALATAGIAALSHQHEIDKQIVALEGLAKQLLTGPSSKQTKEIGDRLMAWVGRARSTRNLFAYMLDEENRSLVRRFSAKTLIEQVADQMRLLLRGVQIDVSLVDPSAMLPAGSFAAWSSIFQNVFLNAVAAMLDAPVKKLSVSSGSTDSEEYLLIEDTGVGVDLETAEQLFEPFARQLELSSENRSLALGGSGLGLTIVRMLTSNVGAKVRFAKPSKGFSTAFRISWPEEHGKEDHKDN